ncbi:ArsR/SmtB family transcription factor [Chloroflexota bacterium]
MLSTHDLEIFNLKADLCKVFSDPKRLIIINELRNGEKQVGELVESLGIPQAVVSRELALLKSKGMLNPRREGTRVYYSLADIKIVEACDIVHEVLLNNLSKNRELAERHLS